MPFLEPEMDSARCNIVPVRSGLAAMPQQLQVRCPRDDWTGVTSTAKRRKLQNRLNQRAYSEHLAFSPTDRCVFKHQLVAD